jgi:DNA replication initiation complex subunit (GINS family)
MMKQFIEQQMAQRATAWEAAKKILDVATAEKRDLTAEETQTYDKISKELEDRQATIEKMRADEARELRLDAATREMADQVRLSLTLHALPAQTQKSSARWQKAKSVHIRLRSAIS